MTISTKRLARKLYADALHYRVVNVSHRILLSLVFVACLVSVPASAQSIALPFNEGSELRMLPQPVRDFESTSVTTARFVAHPEFHARGASDAIPVNALRAVSPLPPHQVIVSPREEPSSRSGSSQHEHPRPLAALKHHRPIQPPPAILPESNRQSTWKAPYSYGYFGASGTRHWSLHYGYRDRSTEWRLR